MAFWNSKCSCHGAAQLIRIILCLENYDVAGHDTFGASSGVDASLTCLLQLSGGSIVCGVRRSDHHLCEEPECAGLLAAFGSAEELAQHRRERHSRAMPRFDRSRARPLPLGDAAFPMRYSRPAAPASPNRSRWPSNNICSLRQNSPHNANVPSFTSWLSAAHLGSRPALHASGHWHPTGGN